MFIEALIRKYTETRHELENIESHLIKSDLSKLVSDVFELYLYSKIKINGLIVIPSSSPYSDFEIVSSHDENMVIRFIYQDSSIAVTWNAIVPYKIEKFLKSKDSHYYHYDRYNDDIHSAIPCK